MAKAKYIYIYIYIYIYTRFQKGFHMERYIDRYIYICSFVFLHVRSCAFFTCHCQHVKNLVFMRNFLSVGFFVSLWKEHAVWIRSFVWKMPSPCSTDLRWRIIWLVLGMRKPAREVAELLGVTQRTIFNILCGFCRNGNVLSCRIGRPNVLSSIARDESFLLMEYIMRHQGA